MVTIFITAPESAADEIAETLVERRLAACVNRFPCQSTFRWEGKIIHDAEEILLAKTTSEYREAVIECVEEMHPYAVPCIETFEESAVLPAFDAWRNEVTESKEET